MSEALLARVKAALIDLAGGMKPPDTRVLLRRMEELDACLADPGVASVIDGRLRHFLQQRSYAKALAWMDRPGESPGSEDAAERQDRRAL
jgi:hypothetical protein